MEPLNPVRSMTQPCLPDSSCGSREHFTRRTLLRGAGIGALGWLTPLAQRLAVGAENTGGRPKSVIVLWLQGGASQLETFDPHPDGKIELTAKAIKTAAPGIRFAEGLEQTAEWMNDLSVIRSVVSQEGDHARATYNAKTGFRPFPGLVHPSIGSAICHEMDALGKHAATLDIPAHISILPGQFPARGGYLGARYDAFQIYDPKNPIADVGARVDQPRQDRRYGALSVLEKSFAAGRPADLERERTLHQASIERAKRMMSSEQLAAFDIGKLPDSEREPFGDTPFGRGCLAALNLIETGVRCVEVTLNGWDTHANNAEGQRRQVDILDPAVASLVRGLKERDLFDDTILLVGTEFGRTPKINVAEGRDHWPHGFSVLLGGGGLKGGLALGETDPDGVKEEPADKVRIENIHATIFSQLGIDYESELMTPIGRPLPISEGSAVKKLVG